MKYEYCINIGQISKNPISIKGKYGNTKEIVISVSKDAARIDLTLSKKYDFSDGSYAVNLVRALLKKIALVHLLVYSRSISYSEVFVSIKSENGYEKLKSLSNNVKLYCMINNRLLRKIPDNLKTKRVLQSLATHKLDDRASDIAAITNYVFSKAFGFETERFIYLWMAFNGMYSYYSEREGFSEKGERAKIGMLLNHYAYGSKILSKANRDKYGKMGMIAVCSLHEPLNIQEIIEGHNDVLNELLNSLNEKNVDFDLTSYGYIVGELTYYLRNSIIHANRPTLILCYEDDIELKALRIANTILEDFLDKHLVEVFLMNT